MVRVRFAPSPTGYLHVGGARTALFNWLFARRHGGSFILRIEDTDTERSSAEMVTGILDGMGWLRLDWDEGPGIGGPHAPYFQSQRYDRHRAAAASLVAAGRAYYCYCSAERLREERERAEARGEAWQYDRRCLHLTPEEIAANEAARLPHAIRFKVPSGKTAFDDVVHGHIEFDAAHIEDFVIVRSDGHPIYHLSASVDDIDMAITHIVRGDDHISNTPKHVLLFRALGAQLPVFAHVPLILGADKQRLSKRHGATSVMEYERQGYLRDALVNFLALLGWSPGDDRELMSREELIEAFTLEGITGSNAIFD
ncbi:MAG: glutamate--tRNA ligase, partial [Acidobacteria bacterium]